jgi:hypothetical protein
VIEKDNRGKKQPKKVEVIMVEISTASHCTAPGSPAKPLGFSLFDQSLPSTITEMSIIGNYRNCRGQILTEKPSLAGLGGFSISIRCRAQVAGAYKSCSVKEVDGC